MSDKPFRLQPLVDVEVPARNLHSKLGGER